MEGFHYLFDINGSEQMVIELTAVTGTTFEANDLLEFSGGRVRIATAASVAIAGVAVEGVTSATAGDKVQVIVGKGSVFRTGYTAGTKTSLADTDIGVAFDIESVSKKTIDLDDITTGMCIVVAYNNDDATADVVLKSRLLNQ